MSKIKKVKDTFVFINDDGVKMGTMNIETGKFVGGTLCYQELYDHTENFKKTNIEYIEEKLKSSESSLNNLRNAYFHFLEEHEKLEALAKELSKKV